MTVGQAALEAGTAISEPIAEGVSQIVDKATNAVLEIIYKGVSYASALLTAAVVSTLSKDAYYMAYAEPKTGKMYYSPIVIDKDFAISIMAANTAISFYTYKHDNARSVAQQAEENKSPILEEATKIGYFDHYHTASHGKAHAFYGLPKV